MTGYAIWIFVIIVGVASIIITYILMRAGDIAASRRTQAAIKEAGEPDPMPHESDASETAESKKDTETQT